MIFDQPGHRTDRLAHGAATLYSPYEGCIIASTPSYRRTSWGHRLMVEEDPRGQLVGWFQRWLDEHRGAGVVTAYVVHEDRVQGPSDAEAGHNLRLDGPMEPPGGFDLRDVTDWAELEALHTAVFGPDEPEYATWAVARRRKRVEAGEARQVGAFLDGALIGAAALVPGETEGRYQDVGVLEAHRGKGIATALVAELAQTSLRPLYINALVGSQAERIYRRLGFEFASRQTWWSLERPLDEAEILRRWRSLRRGTLPLEEWRHSDHLWGAVCVLRAHGGDVLGALDEFRGILQRLLAAHGIETTPEGGYHETLTRGWLTLVATLVSERSEESLESKVIRARLGFGDKLQLLQYWSREVLMSKEARTGWVEPDLKELGAQS